MSNPQHGHSHPNLSLPYYCSDTFPLALPAQLNLSTAAKALGGRKAEERLACLVHRIVVRSHRLDKDAERRGGYIEIQSKEVEALLGSRHAAPALRALVSCGVLQAQLSKEGRHSYRVARPNRPGFCKSYRLAPRLQKCALEFRPLKDACLVRKMRHDEDSKNADAIGSDVVRAKVFASLKTARLPDDTSERVAKMGHDPKRCAAWQLAAHETLAGRFWLRVAPQSGRLYHNLAVMPKALRCVVTLAGEEAAEVDIQNAQPFFLLSLYTEDTPERAAFANVVSTGRFYETVFSAMNAADRAAWGGSLDAWLADESGHRDEFKKHAIAYLLYAGLTNSTGAAKKTRAVFAALARPFPWLHAELTRWRSKQDGGSRLAVEMQRKEAELVLGQVMPRIIDELPDCAPVTIHDAILCQRRFAPRVAQIMEEETAKIYGVSPSVRVSIGG